jgi:ubiquinone/menaquinone biosynthesis C-methylase UbiE
MEIGEQNVLSILANDAQLSFVADDMLSFVTKATTASYDFVFASISIHHLQDSDKERLVNEVQRILRPNGAFMIIDIFLQEDEDRNNFVQDIIAHARDDWVKLNREQADSIINHMFNFDFPAKLTMYEHWAKQNSSYINVKCLESLRFFKTVVLEV